MAVKTDLDGVRNRLELSEERSAFSSGKSAGAAEEVRKLNAERAHLLAEAKEDRVRAAADRVSVRTEMGKLRVRLDKSEAASIVLTTEKAGLVE